MKNNISDTDDIVCESSLVGWCLQQEEYCENYREISITPLEMAELQPQYFRSQNTKSKSSLQPRTKIEL